MQNQPTTPMPSAPSTVQTKSTLKKYWWVFAIVGVLILIIIILAILQSQYVNTPLKTNTNPNPVSTPQDSDSEDTESTNTQSSNVMWSFDGSKWKSSGSAPACEEPVFTSPVDVSLVSNILYPGQTRGGNYKPHGGFRFDGVNNDDISVTAPADSYAFRASRYIEAGEVQYLIDFIVPCGYMYRLDHLLTLSPKFQEMANTLPEAKVDQSQTTILTNTVSVEQGEEIATAVGFVNSSNVSFDWGVYDLREQNEISTKDSTWATQHANAKETAYFGVCWLDILPAEESTVVKALPGSGTEGTSSDYCD